MDFATAPGGNPFLMNDDDFVNQPDNSMASNPFLSGDFSMPAADPALNPFLMGGDDFQASADNSSAGTNPFAMFGMEEEPQPPPAAAPAQTVDFFGGAVPQPDFFVPQEPPVQDSLIFSPERPPPPRPAPPAVPHVPTSLPLAGVVEYHPETTVLVPEEASTVPSRPPPPRPVPPSRETVQLIQAVTGSMEANSSDLLDRLQANRTPSPTPMRDLHSPSPTPDLFNDGQDLLMDTTPAPPPPSATIEQPQTAASFMDIFGGGSDPEPPPMLVQSPEIVEQSPPHVEYEPQPQITQQPPQAAYEPPPQIPQQPPQVVYEQPPQIVQQPPQPVYEPPPQIFQQPPQKVYEPTPQIIQQAPTEQPSTQPTDFFGLFGDACAPAAPPARPAPPVIAMQLTPPEDANLIGDLSSPGGGFSQPQSTETPIAFAAEPRRPPPPKVPPRPPSPAAPQPPSNFPQPTFTDMPKPPTVLTPPEQLQHAQAAPAPEPDEFDSFNDAFSAKFESAGAEKKSGDAFYNAFGATVGGEETGDGGIYNQLY